MGDGIATTEENELHLLKQTRRRYPLDVCFTLNSGRWAGRMVKGR